MLVERALSKGQLGTTVWPGGSSLTSFVSSEKWVSSNHQTKGRTGIGETHSSIVTLPHPKD